MSSLSLINPKAEVMRKQHAMALNVSAATGLQDVLKTNLGACSHACCVASAT